MERCTSTSIDGFERWDHRSRGHISEQFNLESSIHIKVQCMEGSFLLDGKSIKRYDNVLKNTV
jgi:hypothetical protein